MKYDSKVALLSQVLDYAGTFPPAALPLAEALVKAASHREALTHPWLVGRMALPLSEIASLQAETLFQAGRGGGFWHFTALGAPVEGNAALPPVLQSLDADLKALRMTRERWLNQPVRLEIDAYETKLPPGVLSDRDGLFHVLEKFVGQRVTLFLEIGLEERWRETLLATAQGVKVWGVSHPAKPVDVGLKIRTGGKRVPTAEELGEFIRVVTENGLRFKATQGLHAALSQSEGTFGFVNLFSAVSLAQHFGKDFTGKAIVDCLTCSDRSAFQFSEKRFAFKKFALERSDIESARQQHGACFGSCSALEPDESLKAQF